MSSKAKLNYAIDVLIGLAFILSALSGVVLFLAPSGYQGGRNPNYLQPVLFLSRHTWDDLHTWGSMAMIAGVGAHMILHWNWIVCMTRNSFRRKLLGEPIRDAQGRPVRKGPRPARAGPKACHIE